MGVISIHIHGQTNKYTKENGYLGWLIVRKQNFLQHFVQKLIVYTYIADTYLSFWYKHIMPQGEYCLIIFHWFVRLNNIITTIYVKKKKKSLREKQEDKDV